MNNSRLFRFSNVFIAVGVASGLLINNAFAAEMPKEATQYTHEINQQYAKSLPFSNRQDFEDAQRGFIAPLLNEGVLKTTRVKPTTAPMIINSISMRQRRIPLTRACGVKRK